MLVAGAERAVGHHVGAVGGGVGLHRIRRSALVVGPGVPARCHDHPPPAQRVLAGLTHGRARHRRQPRGTTSWATPPPSMEPLAHFGPPPPGSGSGAGQGKERSVDRRGGPAMGLQEVQVQPVSAADLEPIIGPSRAAVLENTAAAAAPGLRRAHGVQRQLDRHRRRGGRAAADPAGHRRWPRTSRPAGWWSTATRSSSPSPSGSTTTSTATPGDGGPLGPERAPRSTRPRWPPASGSCEASGARPTTSCCCTIPRPPGWLPRSCRAGIPVVWRCHVGHRHAERALPLGLGVPAALPRRRAHLRVLLPPVRGRRGCRRAIGCASSRRRSIPSRPRTSS